MDFDPYQPPTGGDVQPRDIAALGELVKAWEKLRGIYNAILILPGLGVLALWSTRTEMPLAAIIFCGVLVGLGANAAFFLGPLAELYIRAWFRHGETIGKGRWLIFSAGLVVSAGVMMLFALITFI
jgi:hypothetical protein